MISREAAVQAVAVLLGFASLVALSSGDLVTGPAGRAISFAIFYGFVLGGAHLYFAVRGEEGTVPVESRWRFLAVLAVGIGLGTMGFYLDDATVYGVEVGYLFAVIAGVSILAYVVFEGVAGYRDSFERSGRNG